MSHEITNTDRLLLLRGPAWHGLGMVIEEELTPTQALVECGLDFEVLQYPLRVFNPENGEVLIDQIPSHVANLRSDTGELLGVVSCNYTPVNNRVLAEFCELLVNEDLREDLVVESIGSVRGGKKVWFLLRGEPFQIAKGVSEKNGEAEEADTIYPYLLVSNGHDGATSLRVTPTTIRVVCSNTLHAVVPTKDRGSLGSSAFVFHHVGSVMDRVGQARKALSGYSSRMRKFREVIDKLADRGIESEEELRDYFAELYVGDFGEVPTAYDLRDPSLSEHERKVLLARRERFMSAYHSFIRRFDDEKPIAGETYWNAVNSYGWLMQHGRKATGRSDEERVLNRIDSNLFGLAQYRSQRALRLAWKRAAV